MSFETRRIAFGPLLVAWIAMGLIAQRAEAGGVELNGFHAFSELDGGVDDLDGVENGVFTVESLTLLSYSHLSLDVRKALIHSMGDVRLEGTAVIRTPDYPVFRHGSSLTIVAGGSISLLDYSRIISAGLDQGGAIALCASLDVFLNGIAGIESHGLMYDSQGGNIELRADQRVRIDSMFNYVLSRGYDGGNISLIACSESSDAVSVQGRILALGVLGNNRLGNRGGVIEVAARHGGARFGGQATNLYALGLSEDGEVSVTAGTSVFPNPPPSDPEAEVTTDSPSDDTCACGPPLSVTAMALSDLTGPVPLGVVFSAEWEGEVVLFEWDFLGDGVFEWSDPNSPQTSYTYNDPGQFNATVRVTDPFGNTATDSLPVHALDGLSADIQATPTDGLRPLTVLFNPSGQSSGPSIDGYRWDWEGDGTWDTGYNQVPSPVTHTYTTAGVYDATLEVRDETNHFAYAVETITVRNPLPTATVSVTPSNGPVPLVVTFTVQASSPNGPIVSVVIDPGDGSADIELPGPGSAPHTYMSTGEFEASVTVTDSAGESIVIDSPLVDVLVGDPGSPTAVASATPSSGPAPLTVMLSAIGSSTPQGSLTLYEWDFEYDGNTFTPDHSSPSTGETSHVYTAGGQRIAALRVTNNSGQSSLDAVGISVLLSATLTIPDDTIDPYSAELASVRTSISADAEVRVFLRDRQGQEVRILFEGPRGFGMYNDLWDGMTNNGVILPDADYYAFLEYVLDGQTHIVPSSPTGGGFGFVSRTEQPSNGAPLDPWQDQFWELTFDTNLNNIGACEVMLWITPYLNQTEEITNAILQNAVHGTGIYTAWWDGIKFNGKYVEDQSESPGSGGDYLWSAQGWRLPDNVIVVQGGRPVITSPSAEPNIFDPTTLFCAGTDGCKIEYTTSHDSIVALRVFNMDTGSLLRQISVSHQPAGSYDLVWDGKAEAGEYVAEGPYRVEITATTLAGNASYLRRVLVYVDY